MIDWKEAARHFRFGRRLAREQEGRLKRRLYDLEAEHARLVADVQQLKREMHLAADRLYQIAESTVHTMDGWERSSSQDRIMLISVDLRRATQPPATVDPDLSGPGEPPLTGEVAALREALGTVQADLIQCQQHRHLCVHEQDALKVANEALITAIDTPFSRLGEAPLTCLLCAGTITTDHVEVESGRRYHFECGPRGQSMRMVLVTPLDDERSGATTEEERR